MKTENEIAKENVKELKCAGESFYWDGRSEEHLASCQRFLKFLESVQEAHEGMDLTLMVREKTTDLQNAINTYGDAGIK